MGTLLFFAVLITIGTFAIRIVMRTGRKLLRSERARKPDESLGVAAHVCRCGYRIDALEVIRCPECGRVFDFDATPEELGLTPDELRRATDRRREREAHVAKP